MEYSPKEMQCKCGNTVVVDRERVWCKKCADPVYYNEKDQKKYGQNHIYVMCIIIFVFGFLAYIFLETIIMPTFEFLK